MLELIEGTLKNFDFYYNLKCEYSAIYWSGYEKSPQKTNLYTHYVNLLDYKEHKNKEIYFIISDNVEFGYIQFTYNKNEIELGIGVSERYSGKGIGTKAINLALEKLQKKYKNMDVVAWIREDNKASERIFKNNGFFNTWKQKKDFNLILNKEVTMFQYIIHLC